MVRRLNFRREPIPKRKPSLPLVVAPPSSFAGGELFAPSRVLSAVAAHVMVGAFILVVAGGCLRGSSRIAIVVGCLGCSRVEVGVSLLRLKLTFHCRVAVTSSSCLGKMVVGKSERFFFLNLSSFFIGVSARLLGFMGRVILLLSMGFRVDEQEKGPLG